ncbi:FtsX-like permease family protein [Streptomyces polychromogenes]|uniref:FtsX-like permease family protein n=1 Tax=Streptomyces polychromogenes TaxID=67342 RepID=A0ABN0VUX0_9ACTN
MTTLPPPTTPRPSATPRPAPAAAGPAPWVATRLRAAKLGTLLAAVLAFVAVLLAAALPRAQDRGADQALRSFLQRGGPGYTSLTATAPPPERDQGTDLLDTTRRTLLAHTGGSFHVDPDTVVYGTWTVKGRGLLNPELDAPSGLPPVMRLLYVRDARAHVRLVEGNWPADAPAAPGTAAQDGPPLKIALSQRAARTIGARLGSVLTTSPVPGGGPRAEVVGLYAVADETEDFWVDLGCLAFACAYHQGDNAYWAADALVGAADLPRLDGWSSTAEDFWRLPVDTGRLRADRLAATERDIASYVTGPVAAELVSQTGREMLRTNSRLPELFTQARARARAAAPLAAIGPAGVAGVALVVLCLAGALAADRREPELRLLLARGGSRAGIVGRLLGEGAVTVLPAAAAATALAVLLLPTPRLAASLISAAAVTLLALLAFPVRAAVLLSPPRPAARWRRPVAELLVLAATGAAVLEVRRRGVAPSGSGVDPLLIAAPLLLALCGGLLLARILPLVTAGLARAAGRSRGLVGFLGLARAARGPGGRSSAAPARGRTGPSVLPLIALLLAVTTGGFGASVLRSVDAARLAGAHRTIGGDAAISAVGAGTLPEGLVKAADGLPGVRTSVALWTDDDSWVLGTSRDRTRVTLVVAEPAAYAALSRALGCGAFAPALLGGGGTGSAEAPVPVLFSAGLARQAAPGTHTLRPGTGGELRVRSAGVIDCTPAPSGPGGETVVLPAGPATALIRGAAHPNRWLATGSVDAERLRALTRAARPAPSATPPAASPAPSAAPSTPSPDPAPEPAARQDPDAGERYLVRTSAEYVAELGADPLQGSAERLFWSCVAAAAGFALLAVLLTLLRSVPERAALLARLRTMGLRRRQGVALILAEALPQTLAATLGGALTAAAAVALLGPAMDLSTLVGASAPTGVGLFAGAVLTPALGLAALVAAAVLVEAATSGRRQITTELRAGDQR